MSNIKFNIEEKLNRPVIALRGLWIYPYSVVHFDAGRKKSIDAIESALNKILGQKILSLKIYMKWELLLSLSKF